MQIARLALSAVVIALGMAGLHMGIEYSGWVLFVGCCGFVGFS